MSLFLCLFSSGLCFLAVVKLLAQALEHDYPKIRVVIGGTAFLSHHLLLLSTDLFNNLVSYNHTGSSYIIGKIGTLIQNLVLLAKTEPLLTWVSEELLCFSPRPYGLHVLHCWCRWGLCQNVIDISRNCTPYLIPSTSTTE